MENLDDDINSDGEWELWDFLISEGQFAARKWSISIKLLRESND